MCYMHEKRKLSELLTLLKQEKHVSFSQMESELGINRSHLCRLNNGTRLPSLHSLIKLSNYYSIKPDVLLETLSDTAEYSKYTVKNNIINLVLNEEYELTAMDINIDIKLLLQEFLIKTDQLCDESMSREEEVKILELIAEIREKVIALIMIKEGEKNEKK